MKKIGLGCLVSLLLSCLAVADTTEKIKVADKDFSQDLQNKLRIRQGWTTNDTHGDVYLITAPDGTQSLIDCGWGRRHETNYHELVLFPVLAEQNIKKLEQVIITHPHGDHFGGLPELLRRKDITIGKILWSYIPPEILESKEKNWSSRQTQQDIIDLCKARNIPIIDVKENDMIHFGSGITAKIFSAGFRNAGGGDWINNQSIVFKLQYKNFSMLFTGDCGFEQENEIMKYHQDELKSDILKCGHHGGAGSTGENFLKAVDPRLVVAPIPDWLSDDPRGKRVEKLIRQAKIPFLRSWEAMQLSIVSDGNAFELVNIIYPAQKKR